MNKKINNEIQVNRNNLDKSSSPYLLQHIANPVWWQEWSDVTLAFAASEEKLLFISVGYATCHWCHVMASEAFSDQATADYLNDNFICIKVDREQRPDIDQYLMDFINNQNGRGGWPLNVFMTPDLRPVYAFTYAPVNTGDSGLSLRTISERVNEFFKANQDNIPPFVSEGSFPDIAKESLPAITLSKYYDPEYGGFGSGQKFPPHSSLLYLLYQAALDDSPSLKTIIGKTLDAILLRGLNDHLQGGIFRYCVDREWTIPHFEKMLYDQAMALWCYALAYRLLGKASYKIMAEKILKCLDECFFVDGLYITAFDADTSHREGATYLWSLDQLKNVLLPQEFEKFSNTYFIDKTGNFDGLNHLLRKNDDQISEIEEKLLTIRLAREQPSQDTKVLCGINALVVIALIQTGRFLNRPDLEKQAASVMNNLLSRFWDGNTLKHSYYNGVYQEQSYLFDIAAVLTAITMLFENDESWNIMMSELTTCLETFFDGSKWRESWAADFKTVYASWLDHPIPSSVSLAQMGLTRVAIFKGKELHPKQYREPLSSDFYNISVMMNNGEFHVFESVNRFSWDLLPVNSIIMKGPHETDCFNGTCSPLGNRYLSA